MNATRLVLVSLFAAVTNVAAHAQQQATPTAAPSPSATSPNAQDCRKANAARHDHAVEKGGGSMAAKPCAPVTSAPAAKANKPHNHATFNKNQ
ncbi:MAG: hypothetical protein J0M00_00405 [Burkholderiales bacterium]|jgi:hypothetical protein|nr:hypothetical protein [Burkholderiales bacterium]